MNYLDDIKKYIPVNEQEELDLKITKQFIEDFKEFTLDRNNPYGHFSASAWVINKDATKVLLNFHNIYKNWGWLGGHVDKEEDFLEVAIREAKEESGLNNVEVIYDYPISLEILPVAYHIKKNKYVNSHLHFNLTYLLSANEADSLHIKPDENSGLKWVELDKAIDLTNEECMKPIYKKLNNFVKKHIRKDY